MWTRLFGINGKNQQKHSELMCMRTRVKVRCLYFTYPLPEMPLNVSIK